ncbi:transglycosylase domain-containing protein [Scatolibacter rhodanostii]|uniref:transglycosylase domain-containing protein n=1 Tax=Scatolibacter rhodanostii TaxID=2014781 RepID=UPI000C068135|nr:transglycosylase domain-containing protein [Scatolibacter rhodanostii]
MRGKEDLNQYSTSQITPSQRRTEGELSQTAGSTTKTLFGIILKTIKTIFFVLMFAGILVLIHVFSYIMSFKDIETDLSAVQLALNSEVKVQNEYGEWETILQLHDAEAQRVIVEHKDIPEHMINAMIAIEDKRFRQHNGVDLQTTVNAVLKLVTGGGGGGSTITQQLIKNVTGNDENSIMRKVKEIFSAINLEKKYSKDEIITSYLNTVNFGANYQGVEAAAQAYFGKSISECNIAESACIAGITQYPYKYNPLIHPENNKERRNVVIKEMYDQGLITKQEYEQAKIDSENMVFNQDTDEETSSGGVSLDWYDEAMYDDVVQDLMEAKNYSWDLAEQYFKTGGLTIYSAKNTQIQKDIEALFKNEEILPDDPEVNFSIYAMDFNGKVLAVVGGRGEKSGDRVFNIATDGAKQVGSSIKPIAVYAPAIEQGILNYSSILNDKKIDNYFDDGSPGPNNFDREDKGPMTLSRALAMSRNTTAVRALDMVGWENSYNFLTNQLHFKHLSTDDISRSPLALGGLTHGATAKEMTAAFQIFGNQGIYHKPYTYLYVEDKDGNVILDNRNVEGERALSPEAATIMNHLLHEPVQNPEGTARSLRSLSVDSWGKTGTAENEYNIWFAGGTSKFVSAIWNGYADRDVSIDQTSIPMLMWRTMAEYLTSVLPDDGSSGYSLSSDVVEKVYCKDSGLIAGSKCTDTAYGWYSIHNIPNTCNGGSDHVTGNNLATPTPTPTPTATPTQTPTPTATPVPTITPPPESTPTPDPTPPPESTPTPDPTSPPEPTTPIPEPTTPPSEPSTPSEHVPTVPQN